MKLSSRINSTIRNMRLSVKRFPISLLMAIILVISLIYLQESSLVGHSKETLVKINMILGLGISLSLCISLLVEKFFTQKKFISTLLYTAGAAFLIIYYFLFLEGKDMVVGSRYLVTSIFLILSFLYIPRLKKDKNYEYYVMDLYSSFSLTFIYSFVLYFGIAAILLTIDGLFDISIRWELYYYMFLIVSLIFALSLFLSKIPSMEEEFNDLEYTKALRVLLLFIVVPLITIYTGILYVYFAKILITMKWPKGLVSHLVLWYSTISVGIIFLITPILEENKLAKLFKIWFPKIILPVLLMMFISISKRVFQYGITENRYYLLVLGLWVSAIMLYFSFKKPLKNIVIPISLSIVMLNSVFGPLSSFSVSKYSQNKRLENILNRNNMIVNGEITPGKEISVEDKREANNIISYFDDNHKLDDIRVFPKDINIKKIEDLTGFKYDPYNPYSSEQGRYFYYNIQNEEEFIDIKGYDYYINMNSWNTNKISIDGLTLQYNNKDHILTILEDEKIILEEEMNSLVEEIHHKQELNDPNNVDRSMLRYEDMTSIIKNEGIELKIIFKNISGKTNSDDELIIDNLYFMLMIKR